MRTLLIEPDAPTRRVVEEVLHRHGHTPHAVADAGQGWSAEGIQTEQHARNVRSLGIDRGQGRYVGKRAPANDMPARLQTVEMVSDIETPDAGSARRDSVVISSGGDQIAPSSEMIQ